MLGRWVINKHKLTKEMINKFKTGMIIVFGLVVVAFMFLYAFGYDQDLVTYIKSRHGEKCYLEGQEHGNIKYPIEFKSLEDCIQFNSN